MADKHPYTPAQGHLVQVIRHFRKSFPTTVTAETLKKLGFAQKNESYILNIFRFLGLIDPEGNRSDEASKIFSLHNDTEFSEAFSKTVLSSYRDLFELHGENTWNLGTDALISFFRTTDGTTENVGKLQAQTFQSLAAFSGYGEVFEPKAALSKPNSADKKNKKDKPKTPPPANEEDLSSPDKKSNEFGLTVRIEINLPADGDQETYDRIFRSIKENLLNG